MNHKQLNALAEDLAFALAGYHGGPGVDLASERALLIEAANHGLLPGEWIERRAPEGETK